MVPQLPGLAYQIKPAIKGVSRTYVNFTSLGWLEGLLFSACVPTIAFCAQAYSAIGSLTISCAYYSPSRREPMKKTQRLGQLWVMKRTPYRLLVPRRKMEWRSLLEPPSKARDFGLAYLNPDLCFYLYNQISSHLTFTDIISMFLLDS